MTCSTSLPRAARPWSRAVPALVAGALLTACVGPGDDATATPSAGATASATGTSSPGATTGAGSTPGAPADPGVADPGATPPGATDPGAPAPSAPAGGGGGDERAVATVVVTYATWDATEGVLVAGYVDGVVEDGGTCRVRLVGPGPEATGTAPATPDAGSTSCGQVAATPAGSGTWTATLEYTSAGARGTSAPVEVVVP